MLYLAFKPRINEEETHYQVVDFFLVFFGHSCGASHCHEVLSCRTARQVSAVARGVEGGVTVLAGKGNHRLKKHGQWN